jgi:hypothetical protein
MAKMAHRNIRIKRHKAISPTMKKAIQKLLLILLFAITSVACDRTAYTVPVNKSEQAEVQAQPVTGDAHSILSVDSAYEDRLSNVSIEGQGMVVKILADDNNGSRHQKFLVKIANGKTLLFAHNIDLALRIEDIKIGDEVTFRGEYVFNPKGGVIHWTHHDPRGEHVAGWIKHNGQKYE